MVRSTEVRKSTKTMTSGARKCTTGKRQVVIGNNSFGKYKGELQIILKEMPIDERKNIVGTIAEEELFLLDYVGAWTQFIVWNRERRRGCCGILFSEIVVYRI